jgi:hypothetical protein
MYFGPPIKDLLETHLKQAYMEQTNLQKKRAKPTKYNFLNDSNYHHLIIEVKGKTQDEMRLSNSFALGTCGTPSNIQGKIIVG